MVFNFFLPAMFCSDDCQQKAMKDFHQFECNLPANPKMSIDYPIRMIVKCLSIFNFNIAELKKFLEKNSKQVTLFDFDFSDPSDNMYEKNMILVALSIRNTASYLKMGKMIVRSETSAFVSRHPKLQELWSKHAGFLNELMEKAFVALSPISHLSAWFSKDVNLAVTSLKDAMIKKINVNPARAGMHQENVGQGMYPFFASLNGSCDRNVSSVCVSNKVLSIVCRPIKAGSQLFRMNSEPFYNHGPAAARRAQIQQMFGYWCDCEPCKKDWPTYEGLRAVDPFFQYRNAQTFSSHKEARETVARNNVYVDANYIESDPTQEVCITIDNNSFELNGLARPAFYP